MARGLNYLQWNPGTNHGERTFREVLATLPATPPDGIPWVIRLFENPSSRWASPGAITLARHDHVHVLLGRGLKGEDEGFVIGFTCGAATQVENRQTALLRAMTYLVAPFADRRARDRRIRDWQYAIFEFAATRLYRPPYRFGHDEITAFRLGYGFGERCPVRDVHDFPFEDHEDDTVGEVRERLGVGVAQLEAVYRQERALLHSRASERLDTDADEDHSDIAPPDGPDSDWVREKAASLPPARGLRRLARFGSRIRAVRIP